MHTVKCKQDGTYAVSFETKDTLREIEGFTDRESAYRLCNYLNGGDGKFRWGYGGAASGGYCLADTFLKLGGMGDNYNG